MNKVVKSTVVYVLVAIVGLFLLAKALTATPGREKLDTLEFTRLLEAKQVDTAKLYDRDHVIKGELKDGKKYELKFPDRYTDEIITLLEPTLSRLHLDATPIKRDALDTAGDVFLVRAGEDPRPIEASGSITANDSSMSARALVTSSSTALLVDWIRRSMRFSSRSTLA